MKTINEIKKEYEKEEKRHDKKVDDIMTCNIVNDMRHKRMIILDVFDKDWGFPGGVIPSFDFSNIDAKFATLVDKKENSHIKPHDWIEMNLLVIVDGLGHSDFGYFSSLKHNEEFKKLVEEYNNFIDEVRDK